MHKLIGLITFMVLALAFIQPAVAALVFSDDFEREEIGSDWTTVAQTWSIQGGELVAEGANGRLASGRYYENFSVEVKMKIVDYGVGPNYWAGIIARATNPLDDCWQSGYLVYLRYNGFVELYTKLDGVIAQADTGVTPNDFVTIIASFTGSNIQVYVNGILYIDVDHGRYSDGYFSLKNYVAEAHFDDVIIENPLPSNVVPEPAPIIISLLFAAVFAAYVLVRYRKPSFNRRI